MNVQARRCAERITIMSTEITTNEPKRKAKATKKAKAAKTTRQAGKAPKSAKAKSTKPNDTNKELVLGLLRRKGGATIAEIAKATGWQNHSIRGFISGTLTKKMRLSIESSKNEGEDRTYRIAE
jgi:hypothetical protein